MSTHYIDRTGTEEWALSARGLCTYCATDCNGGCPARWCDSCTAMWLSDTPADTDEDGPFRQYCPDCVASLCQTCGYSASHDVHDPRVAILGGHPYRELAPFVFPESPQLRGCWELISEQNASEEDTAA